MKINSKEKIKLTRVNKDIYINMVYAILIMGYFVGLNFLYINVTENVFKIYIKVSYMMFLIIAIIMLELSYSKKHYKLAIHGVEYIIIATYIALIETVITILNFEMIPYIVMSSYIFPIYYTLKAIIIETQERINTLKNLSDIKEIVKEEKPVKKVAKKRKI